MLRLRLNSSFRVVRTAAMSSFTSSRLIISSTNAALMFTLAVCPFAFANIKKATKKKETLMSSSLMASKEELEIEMKDCDQHAG